MGYLTGLLVKCTVAGTIAFLTGLAGRWIYRRYFCDPTVYIEPDDAAMLEAIGVARDSLPQFWRAFEKPLPGQEQFMLKVRIPCDDGAEYVWCHVAERNGNVVNGVVANRPLDAPFKFGDSITFFDDDISDWLYFYLGRPVGGETGRAIEKTAGYAPS